MKILYLSEFVVGRPDGPGVNELEFWKSLSSHAVDSEGVFAEHRGGDKKTKYEYLIRQLYLLKKIFLFALSGKKIDVIIARSGPLPLATLVASLLLRSPVYIKTVGDGAFKVLADNKSLLHKLGYFLCRLLWKMLLKRAVAVDAVSKAHILNFSRNLNFPLRLCYEIDNGVNTDFFDGRKKTNSIGSDFNSWRKKYSKIVGYVGGYPLERGASELILLSSKLKKLGIGVLVVGGDKNTIEEFVKRNGQGNVWVAGQVEYAAVPGYMSEMDVGVSLLDKAAWGASEQKLRQYLSSGVPSVCTIASNAALIDAGVVIPVSSICVEEVFAALQKALVLSSDDKYKSRIRGYAESTLSVSARVVKRLEIISEKL